MAFLKDSSMDQFFMLNVNNVSDITLFIFFAVMIVIVYRFHLDTAAIWIKYQTTAPFQLKTDLM